MTIDIKAPAFPESVADGEVAAWHKKEGEAVQRDELLVEIETDKVVLEVVAPADGVIEKIHAAEGEVIASEALLATFAAGAAAGETAAVASPAPAQTVASADTAAAAPDMGPAARQLVEEHKLDARLIPGTGKGGRITKEDVLAYLDGAVTPEPAPAAQGATPAAAAAADTLVEVPHGPSSERVEKRVPMTRMRARIAERLLEATQQTAMLTTFNEVNMAPVMALRKQVQGPVREDPQRHPSRVHGLFRQGLPVRR
jgi:2-oxoglutarate dehydrogenase E2 component (dihydrolipoamide succinyltransferase)